MRLVSLNLPVDLIAAIGRAARDAGQAPQDLLRATLRHMFIGEGVERLAGATGAGDTPAACQHNDAEHGAPGEPPGPQAGHSPGAPGAADPAALPDLPPFAVHLAFAGALGWLDLQSRLRAAGFVLRLGEDGVLALHTWPADHRLIDSAAIGQPLAELTLRFRAAFPGQVLAKRAAGVERRLPTVPHRKGRAA